MGVIMPKFKVLSTIAFLIASAIIDINMIADENRI